MPFYDTKTRTWKDGITPADGTPALGTLFDAEFDQLYENDNYLKDIIDAFNTYEVAAGEAVTAGKVVEFINGYIQNFKGDVKELNNPPVVFESANTYEISAVALAADKVLVSYTDGGNSIYGTSIVLSISGTAITAGTPVVFESAATSYISAVALAADKVLVSYKDGGNSNYGTSIVLSISGTAITAGTPVVFESANTYEISAVALAADKVLVAYQDLGNSSYGTAIILSISGTTITAGAAVVFEAANTDYCSSVALAADKVLVVYRDRGNSDYGTSIVLSISGTAITAGTPVVFESAATSYISAVALAADKVLVSYKDGGNSNYGTSIVLSISGTAITDGTPIVFESATTSAISAVALASDKALVLYSDGDNGSYGTSKIIQTNNFSKAIGISSETVAAGLDCDITTFANNKFVTTGLSGLSAAQRYYAASNGDLVTAPLTVLQLVLEIFTPLNLMVGLGVDATTLLVDNLLYGGDI